MTDKADFTERLHTMEKLDVAERILLLETRVEFILQQHGALQDELRTMWDLLRLVEAASKARDRLR